MSEKLHRREYTIIKVDSTNWRLQLDGDDHDGKFSYDVSWDVELSSESWSCCCRSHLTQEPDDYCVHVSTIREALERGCYEGARVAIIYEGQHADSFVPL